jgi:hypothetical protein
MKVKAFTTAVATYAVLLVATLLFLRDLPDDYPYEDN